MRGGLIILADCRPLPTLLARLRAAELPKSRVDQRGDPV